MSTTTLQIQGMSCGGCVKSATRALSSVPGITPKDVQIGSAKIEVDSAQATAAQAIAALEKAGFQASALQSGH